MCLNNPARAQLWAFPPVEQCPRRSEPHWGQRIPFPPALSTDQVFLTWGLAQNGAVVGNFPMQRAFGQSCLLSPTHTAHSRFISLMESWFPFADRVRDGVQGEHPRRGAQSAAAQHGLQPKCPLPPALLCHTESFGLKGESPVGAEIHPEGGRRCFFLCMGSLPQAVIILASINGLVFMGSTCISAFWGWLHQKVQLTQPELWVPAGWH